jgi:probable HAF family extracellular repeat protein
MLSRFARGVQKFLTPKNAYAIDVGLGGLSRSLSPFNDVDPLGTPDISVESLTANSPAAPSGGAVTLTYTLRNIGTATPDPENIAILLTPTVTIEGAPVSRQVLSFVLPPIVPGSSSTTTNQSVTIPADVAPGTYHLAVAVADNPLFPDANANNNSASLDISVDASIVDLGMLPGDNSAAAMAINEAGHVVGFGFSPTSGFPHVFRWINGQMTSLGEVRALDLFLAINDSDVVVGSSFNSQTQLTAFRWKDGVFTDLGTLPSSLQSVGVGVNVAGDVVGFSEYTNGAGRHGWIWRNGVMTDLGFPPGASDFEPGAINDAGEIVGTVGAPPVSAWIWRDGTFTQLPVTGSAAPRSINTGGAVVGFSFSLESSRRRAVEWLNGQRLDLPLPNGTVNSSAVSISSDGRIVGYAFPDQTSEAYITYPTLWQSGTAINLPTLGGIFSQANGVKTVQTTLSCGRHRRGIEVRLFLIFHFV